MRKKNTVLSTEMRVLFDVESDGLVGLIDITERNKNHTPCEAVFNSTGDSLIVGDSRQVVTLLQIANNRFNVVTTNLKELPSVITFTGK